MYLYGHRSLNELKFKKQQKDAGRFEYSTHIAS